MPLILTMVVLAAAVVVSGPLSRWWNRRAGFALALLYLVATVVFWPVVPEVLAGGTPTWSIPWLTGLGPAGLEVAVSLRADGLGVVFSRDIPGIVRLRMRAAAEAIAVCEVATPSSGSGSSTAPCSPRRRSAPSRLSHERNAGPRRLCPEERRCR